MPPGRPRKNYDKALFKSAEMIGWAIGGLEREILQTRERLNVLTEQVAKLRARTGTRAAAGSSGEPGKRRRRMSAEARKRISDMMKKRWAERRKGKA